MKKLFPALVSIYLALLTETGYSGVMAPTAHSRANSAVDTTIGFAPSVIYVRGKGWAGVVHYFEKHDIGMCSYRENNLKYSHGAAIIPEEDA